MHKLQSLDNFPQMQCYRIWTISRCKNCRHWKFFPQMHKLQNLDNFPDAEFLESGPIPRCRFSKIWTIFIDANLKNLDVVSHHIFWTSDLLDIFCTSDLLDIFWTSDLLDVQIIWSIIIFYFHFLLLKCPFGHASPSPFFNIMWDKYVGKFGCMTIIHILGHSS